VSIIALLLYCAVLRLSIYSAGGGGVVCVLLTTAIHVNECIHGTAKLLVISASTKHMSISHVTVVRSQTDRPYWTYLLLLLLAALSAL